MVLQVVRQVSRIAIPLYGSTPLTTIRFDYLFYQFVFSEGPDSAPRQDFIFIPERELPDEFFSTETNPVQDFSGEPFKSYRIHMDTEGLWAHEVARIIRENPRPRGSRSRPFRRSDFPEELRPLSSPRYKGDNETHGRHVFDMSMVRGQQQFFHGIMVQCAKR